MPHLLATEIELLETLQALHQQHMTLAVKWISQIPKSMERHICNLPRIRLVTTEEEAALIVGEINQLKYIKKRDVVY